MTETKTVENYKFEPIKGYPMLNWRGKRPFTTTQYFPAQLKESYGKDLKRNKIFHGDNISVMSHMIKNYRSKIDLIYIDPPFDSRADYRMSVKVKGESSNSNYSAFEEKQYNDIWVNDSYLQFMYERLILMKELLSDKGSIYLHCDWNKGHYLKLILDEVFGAENFKNHIVWKRSTPRGNASTRYPEITDFILFYTKGDSASWNAQYSEYRQEYVDQYYNQIDEITGKKYQPTSLMGHEGVNPVREWRGLKKPWRYPIHRLDELDKEGKIHWPASGGIPRYKRFLDEQKGVPVQSLWDDIAAVNSQSNDDTKYPTQKPEELLKRIILASSNEGDIVFDCFMGSGTTQKVACDLKRIFIGSDINLSSVEITKQRLLKSHPEISLDIFNVNEYDLFKNPMEAKDILIQALEVIPLNAHLFDGEKDGRMVKIMPVNRIATRADLNELINGFDYKTFKKRKESTPNKPVEKILLVCMGHEVDLKASLQLAAREAGFDIDVEVVDILRDKSELLFKRDSEAKVSIKNGKLIIDKFYPMNLLQKLSLQKSKVENWKELVESVMIDWNYDGVVLSPAEIDIPEKEKFVSGVYEIPKDTGKIRVKITDLLSESIEIEVSNG